MRLARGAGALRVSARPRSVWPSAHRLLDGPRGPPHPISNTVWVSQCDPTSTHLCVPPFSELSCGSWPRWPGFAFGPLDGNPCTKRSLVVTVSLCFCLLWG